MAVLGDTGNGATITLGTTSFAAAVQSIQIGEITVESIDVSVLGTSGDMISIPAALRSTPEVTVTLIVDTSLTPPTPGSAAETITVTWPLRAGESTAANLAGTAYITSYKHPDFNNGEAQVAEYKFKYDGDTGPTFTAGS